MKFQELSNLLFIEALAKYKYTLPKDKEQLLYDFYMLDMLRGLPNAPKGPSIGAYREDLDIEASLDETIKSLYPQLKQEMLDAVLFSVSSEFRHIFDGNSGKEIRDWAKKNKILAPISKYILAMAKKSKTVYNDFFQLIKSNLKKQAIY